MKEKNKELNLFGLGVMGGMLLSGFLYLLFSTITPKQDDYSLEILQLKIEVQELKRDVETLEELRISDKKTNLKKLDEIISELQKLEK